MIQITRTGTVLSGSAADLEELRTEFDRNHCALLPGLLEPGLLRFFQRQIERSELYEEVDQVGSSQIRIKNDLCSGALRIAVNNSKLFQAVRAVTGCGHIGCFDGAVYRMLPGSHHDQWHADLEDDRLVALSINLSTEAYEGGVLRIREVGSKQIVHEVSNTGFGDGIIFRLAPHLEHRVTEVTGMFPKTAYAGWFRAQPEFISMSAARAAI